jgi:hypothetical protein
METGEKRERVEALRNGPAGEMSAAPPVFHQGNQYINITSPTECRGFDLTA